MFKKAFTLAEILIVMAIIGTVAVATIPNLMDSYQEDRDVAKLRGVYHDLEVAYAKAVAEYGPYENWGSDKQKTLMKFLRATPCSSSSNSCFPTVKILGINVISNTTNYELENGVGLGINNTNIFVALNGAKGKAEVKKNVFGFTLNNEGIIPMGKGTDKDSNGKLKISGYGFDAANWVITNGNMDYLRCLDQLNWTNQTSCP